jgi:hypothetical protein
MSIQPVTMYKSGDGQIHPSHVDAQAHELAKKVHKELDSCEKVSDRLNANNFMETKKVCKWLIMNGNLQLIEKGEPE